MSTQKLQLSIINGGKTQKIKTGSMEESTNVESITFKDNSVVTNIPGHPSTLPEKEEYIVGEFVTNQQLESFKELSQEKRENDSKLLDEKLKHLDQKILHGNEMISQKIDNSNQQISTSIDSAVKSLNKEIETIRSGIDATLEMRFNEERALNAKEAQATRKWFWALSIPTLIGIAQVVLAIIYK